MKISVKILNSRLKNQKQRKINSSKMERKLWLTRHSSPHLKMSSHVEPSNRQLNLSKIRIKTKTIVRCKNKKESRDNAARREKLTKRRNKGKNKIDKAGNN